MPQKYIQILLIHSYNTQSNFKTDYFVPLARIGLTDTLFSYCDPKIHWKSIPVEIGSAYKFILNTKFKSYLLSTYNK